MTEKHWCAYLGICEKLGRGFNCCVLVAALWREFDRDLQYDICGFFCFPGFVITHASECQGRRCRYLEAQSYDQDWLTSIVIKD